MTTDTICPCCQSAQLDLISPDGPGEPYGVKCPFCGTRFGHDLLQDGYNGALKFLSDIGPVEPEVESVENWAYDETATWECSGCLKRRTYVKGEPPFRFCPDCGKPVEVRDGD